ncbi:Hypothetical predicted protein [Octopus vulgaris]|uniref:Uncharacterized protein n=1 Tax=Octopus vulgaris TaxID=6645 RepID=A0AA36AI01_OCTVU|nr:Hypothetical predicted protein [Octopus vulgaris]
MNATGKIEKIKIDPPLKDIPIPPKNICHKELISVILPIEYVGKTTTPTGNMSHLTLTPIPTPTPTPTPGLNVRITCETHQSFDKKLH